MTNAKIQGSRLELDLVLACFAQLSGLAGEALEVWAGLCQVASQRICRRLREPAVETDMQRLCYAAAAVAYADYRMIQGVGTLQDVRVGDMVLKEGADARSAEEIQAHFLAQVADLLEPEQVALLGVEW